MVKHIFLGHIAWKKKLEKWSFFDQNLGLTALEIFQFVDFFNLVFL